VHDIKNPLSTIALEACLLDGKLAHGEPSDTRDALARITRNVEFLDRMVQDLSISARSTQVASSSTAGRPSCACSSSTSSIGSFPRATAGGCRSTPRSR
jgi:signal transduction histidine kinase